MVKKNNYLLYGAIIVAFIFISGKGGFFGAVAPPGNVERSISPESPQPGETITVTLSYGGGDKGIAIHDESPFIIIENGNNIYEAAYVSQGSLTPEIDVYTMTAGPAGEYNFNGIYRIDGSGLDIPIGGVTSFDVVADIIAEREVFNHHMDKIFGGSEKLFPEWINLPGYSFSLRYKSSPSGGYPYTLTDTLSGDCTFTDGSQILTFSDTTGTYFDQGTHLLGNTDCIMSGSYISNGITKQLSTITIKVCGDGIIGNTAADKDCNNIIEWTEINTAIGDWLIGTYSWNNINDIIGAWIGG